MEEHNGSSETPALGPGQHVAIKCGWLRKQGGFVKTWHTRWFVLRGDQLYYFKDEDETKPLFDNPDFAEAATVTKEAKEYCCVGCGCESYRRHKYPKIPSSSSFPPSATSSLADDLPASLRADVMSFP